MGDVGDGEEYAELRCTDDKGVARNKRNLVPFVSTPRGTGSLLEFESQSPDINKLEINQKSQLDVQASV